VSVSNVYTKAVEVLAKRGIGIEFIYTIQGHLKVYLRAGRHLVGVMLDRHEVKPPAVKAAVQQALQELSLQSVEVACPGS